MFSDKATVYFLSFIGFISIVFCGFLIYAGFYTWKEVEEGDYKSCILSMKDTLIKPILDDKTVREAINVGSSWRTLNKNEVDMLFNSLDKAKKLDCGNYPDSKTSEGVQIAIRQINGRIEMDLQINGRIDTTLQEIK